MVVCRFFQQGNCRFGNNCKFEHPRNDYGAVVSPLLRNGPHQPLPTQHIPGLFVPARAATSNLSVEMRDIFNGMRPELELIDRGSLWALTVYNPLPSKCTGSIGGLEDHSPEELRFWFYTARALNSLESCNQEIQKLYKDASMKRSRLKIPNRETFLMIEAMLIRPRETSTRHRSTVVDNWPVDSTATSGSPLIQNSIFGASSTQSSVFGGAPQASVFGGTPQQQSSFGGSATTPSTNVFNAASATPQAPLFGNATQPTQPAQPAQATQQMSVFGGPSPFGGTSQTSFAQAAPFSGTAPQASIFGGNVHQQTTPFSGSDKQASFFGGAALPQPSNFTFALPKQFGSSSAAQPPASGPFGEQTIASQSIFGGSASQTVPSEVEMDFDEFQNSQTVQNAQNASVFGTAPTATIGPFSSSSSSDNSLHTPIAELTEPEKSEFTASKFTSGLLPIRPPPKEFCT